MASDNRPDSSNLPLERECVQRAEVTWPLVRRGDFASADEGVRHLTALFGQRNSPTYVPPEDWDGLIAYPNLHNCMMANVVAFEDLLALGDKSRFWARKIPQVHWAFDVNYDIDDEDGSVYSMEIFPDQDECRQEANTFPAVAWTLPVRHAHDWFGFFRTTFDLMKGYEVYCGEQFVCNVFGPKPPKRKKNETHAEIFSLRPAPTDRVEAAILGLPIASTADVSAPTDAVPSDRLPSAEANAATSADPAGDGPLANRAANADAHAATAAASSRRARAGIVMLLRKTSPDVQVFGMWYGWFVDTSGRIYYVDLSSEPTVETRIADVVSRLNAMWEEGVGPGAFWAECKRF